MRKIWGNATKKTQIAVSFELARELGSTGLEMSEYVSILELDEDGVIQLLSNLGFPFYDAQIKGHSISLASPP